MQETLLPIQAVARKLEIPEKYLEQLGSKSGKVKLELLSDPTFKRRGKLIIVTATTPTAAGEGKTVTSISLTQALAQDSRLLCKRLFFRFKLSRANLKFQRNILNNWDQKAGKSSSSCSLIPPSSAAEN